MNPQADFSSKDSSSPIPSINLPKGGGAIRGIGEKFGANPVTGTGSMRIPLHVSPGRSGFHPQLALTYDSGAGNGPFGLGWRLQMPSITRKTEKGLPRYRDAEESDVFLFSDAEDLVPRQVHGAQGWADDVFSATLNGVGYRVRRYRPRIEQAFTRIERWTRTDNGTSFWRTIDKDNRTNVYGADIGSRIVDPDDDTRIFQWLLAYSHDDRGNLITYEYKAENRDNVAPAPHEQHRKTGNQRYLKTIRYGNAAPYYPDADAVPALPMPGQWLFHVAFDYGEHDSDVPQVEGGGTWTARSDPFSSYRAGFEIRNHRLCQRVLMFHQFDELGATPCLVCSTDFSYRPDPALTVLESVRHTAVRRNPDDQSYQIEDADGGILSPRSLPPLSFTYSEAVIDATLHTLAPDAQSNLPEGVDDARYRWLDLDSEGLPGVLAEQADGWFYQRNISNLPDDQGTVRARFEPLQPVASRPATARLAEGRQQFTDLDGSGQQCLAELEQPLAGYYARGDDGAWDGFTAFPDVANIDWHHPNLQRIDLNGDGWPDVLISEDEYFTWYPSLGKAGFGPARQVRRAADEDLGPALVFADGTHSIHLADMSGDGLTDLVRIRNGEICYWPNLGYGRFGSKLTMSGAPLFDAPDLFDQQRLRLADIDGSGVTDIVYLAAGEVRLYFNQAGNGWSAPHVLEQFPLPDHVAAVTTLDLLGNGTACLAWSSPLPGDAGRALRYVDLMSGQKPHLLTEVDNGLGLRTRVQYAASTRFYLQDRRDGMPWLTRLPFPVHVIERVETTDAIAKTRFASRYAYHHGYFDGAEREFRGFGMVEQWDTEAFAAFADDDAANLDSATDLPPVLTRTWFHTGAGLPDARISLQFREQYYREPGLTDAERDSLLLPDTALPAAVILGDGASIAAQTTTQESREAFRALKGAMLRQEVYALDGSPRQSQPVSVSEHGYRILWLQPQGRHPHAVFSTVAQETIDYRYERTLYDINGQQRADPRVSHAMTLVIDAWGNPLQSAAITYGRRFDDGALALEDRDRQRQAHITVTELRYTDPVDAPHQYRTPLMCEKRRFELINAALPDTPHVTPLLRRQALRDQAQAASDGLHDLPYEDLDAAGATEPHPYRRLIEHLRIVYRKDDLSAPLPLTKIEPLALPHEQYRLALTPGLLALYASKITQADAAAALTGEGGYVDLDGDGRLWIPSGRPFFSPDPVNPDPAHARSHFYLVRGTMDAFSHPSFVAYDTYDLLPAATTDAVGNVISAEYDYRTLQPGKVIDANGNRTEIALDLFGRVTATAVMGKAQEPDNQPKGDALQDATAELSTAAIEVFFSNPPKQAAALLGTATTRTIVDVGRFHASGQANRSATLVRETHVSDLGPGETTRIQVSLSYLDGTGREIQKKILSEPGQIDAQGPVVDPRWVGSGWTVFNNKGNPVKRYEPFFTASHDFEFAAQHGVGATLFYDPPGRVVATLRPDQTYEKVLFDPWRQQTWDVNDTVLHAPADDPDVGASMALLASQDIRPGWHALRTDPAHAAQAVQRWPDPVLRNAEAVAAQKAAAHADTPALAYLDALGRTFLTIADNGPEGQHATRAVLDIEGHQHAVIDALGRTIVKHDHDMAGNRIRQHGMETGLRWIMHNAAGKPVRGWDQRDHQTRHVYDALLRPTQLFIQTGNAQEALAEKIEYGETQPDADAFNLRGRMARRYDSAGVTINERYDFKGNLLSSSRQLAHGAGEEPDWNLSPALGSDIFISTTRYDALNRPVQTVMPHVSGQRCSVIQPGYNEANLPERIDVWQRHDAVPQQLLDPVSADLHAVTGIDYDAKGQRCVVEYGNGVATRYGYDDRTFRLIHLDTVRAADGIHLQDVRYTYDPAGNLTHIQDDADIQNTVYFKNQRVEPSADYMYDALYRLVQASGREHLGQIGGQLNPPPQTIDSDGIRTSLPQPGDGNAMARYTEDYLYDQVGNLLRMTHAAGNGGWTRRYACQEASLIEPARNNNRLSATSLPGDADAGPFSASYQHDAHGNMTQMPHLDQLAWDSRDRLLSVNLGGGGHAYYTYDAAGRRVRKTIHRQNGTRQKERIYLDGIEIYREYDGSGDGIVLERTTLHVNDGDRPLMLAEWKTIDAGAAIDSPVSLTRYQYNNHQGSAGLELDDAGAVISYEEYYPYGSTSYQAGRDVAETGQKRYRYTGKERDEETGLYYHGARYYAPWLGRWISADPAGISAGENLYAYVKGNPIKFHDPDGRDNALSDKSADLFKILVPAIIAGGNEKGLSAEKMYYLIVQSYQEQGPSVGNQQKNGRYRLFNEHAPVEKDKSGQMKVVDGQPVLKLSDDQVKKLEGEGVHIEGLSQGEEKAGKPGKVKLSSPTFTYDDAKTSVTQHVDLLKSEWKIDIKDKQSFERFAERLFKSGYATAGKSTPEIRSDDYDQQLTHLEGQVKGELTVWLNSRITFLDKRIETLKGDIEMLKHNKEMLESRVALRLEGIGEDSSYLMPSAEEQLRNVNERLKKQEHKLVIAQAEDKMLKQFRKDLFHTK